MSVLLAGLSACSGDFGSSNDSANNSGGSMDLPAILKRGKLIVLAENSTSSYFIYKGRQMGFEYELLKEFANELGVGLEVKIVSDLNDITKQLNKGEADILACNLAVTSEIKSTINFSKPFIRTQQVLVQRKPANWSKMSPERLWLSLIHDPTLLAGKKVHVRMNSNHYQRLVNLQEEMGERIQVKTEPGTIGTEELIQLVADGIIDYTVTEQHIARINQLYFDNIDISTPLSIKQQIAFGLRKSSPLLQSRLNKWLDRFMAKQTFGHIKRKYFEISKPQGAEYLAGSKSGQLSKFDDAFKRAALKYKFDWRLLASIAYHESKFNPYIKGLGGAFGLMQFMPKIGPKYGVHPSSPPEVQIQGAMKMIAKTMDSWRAVPEQSQREKFTLASYNCGRSHVEDAQRLAKKYGLNHLRWDDNVEVMMLNLTKSQYYRDPVVKNGALRGTRTYSYVRAIYSRYLDWKSVYP